MESSPNNVLTEVRKIDQTVTVVQAEVGDLLRRISQTTNADSFNCAWMNVVEILRLLADGGFHGTIQIEYRGDKVKGLEIVYQRVNLPERLRSTIDKIS